MTTSIRLQADCSDDSVRLPWHYIEAGRASQSVGITAVTKYYWPFEIYAASRKGDAMPAQDMNILLFQILWYSICTCFFGDVNAESNQTIFWCSDLTVGSPTVNLLKFSVPLLIGNIAQQLYSTVDSIIVGRYIGDTALASIGATMPVINLLLVLFMAVATGAGILVSQYFGARSWKNLDKAVGNALTLIFISSIVMMAIAIPLAEPILSLLGTPDEIISMSSSYMRIIFIGILGFGFFNITSGILRGLGDSITPLLFLLLTAVMNTILDIWFVAYLDFGVSGAAAATVLSQVTSAILA